ncbi:MAG: Rne/Rng family ribonuclease [Chitinophagaceae bacterium]
MNKELIINAAAHGVEIALLEDKRLVELHSEKTDARFAVGDLYLGRVKKLIPGLNAAFVDVGHEKDAFLHYTDLSPYAKSLLKFTQQSIADGAEGSNFSSFSNETEIIKTGKINEVLSGKPNILVQILKEPIAAKGPRLSCEISLPGRYVVLTPFNDVVAVSRKIHSSEERKRLQKIIESVKKKNFGVIVRTAAEGKNTAELHEDLTELVTTWETIQKNLKGALAPAKILSEQTKTTSILRDLLTADFNRIVTNDKDTYTDAKSYIQKIAPEKSDIVTFHQNGAAAIFDQYGITKQVKSSFGKTVNLNSGAYIIIEHTEALHVIDVNSGYKSVSNNQEQNALETNLEAAEEVARQLRLRDIGGIIVVDFIDMKLPENKRKLVDAMEGFMQTDRAKHAVLPISKFGLMQITRQRMKPEMNINTQEVCPSCHGTGKIASTLILEDDIEKNLNYLITHQHKNLTVVVSPIVYAYLTKGWLWSSKAAKWKRKFGTNVTVKADSNYHLIEFRFFDAEGEEIKI